MTKLISAITAFCVALVFTITPIKADPFDGGLAIGVLANFSDFKTAGKETEGSALNANTDVETHTKTFDKSKDFPSLFVEGTIRQEGGLGFGLTLGGEYIPGDVILGSGSRADTTSDATETNQDDTTYTAKAEASDLATFYAEPTFYINDNFGIYGTIGISTVNVKSLEEIGSGTDSSQYGDKMVTGSVVGFGLRAISPWGIFVKIDYRETDYDNITLESSSGNLNKVSADIDQEATRLSIGYQF